MLLFVTVVAGTLSKPEPSEDTLLQHLRTLTVDERLAWNDAAVAAALELRRAFLESCPVPAAGAASVRSNTEHGPVFVPLSNR